MAGQFDLQYPGRSVMVIILLAITMMIDKWKRSFELDMPTLHVFICMRLKPLLVQPVNYHTITTMNTMGSASGV